MGYYISSYGINTAQIQNAFGSKDDALLEAVKDNSVFQHYDDNDFGDDFTTEQALTEIIDGELKNRSAGYAYGYATIGLCATLGTELPYCEEIKLGHETDRINKVLSEVFGIRRNIEEVQLRDSSHPFPLPRIEDWPLIGLMRRPQLQELADRLSIAGMTHEKLIALAGEADDDDFTCDHLMGILENIRFCLQHDLDMVSFCH